jgi:hypothetical protein
LVYDYFIPATGAGDASRCPDFKEHIKEHAMISLEDCIGLCGLSEVEVQALAEHEHVPEIVAAALAQYLLRQPEGCRTIGAMIADDVNWAAARGDQGHAEELKATLLHFLQQNPEAWASLRAQACLKDRQNSVS